MAHYYRTAKGKELPDIKDATGEVLAFINQGRWIAECPDCHDARVASSMFPYFICLACDFNNDQFANVVFPAEKVEIEAELEKRIALHPFKAAPTRNWTPVETLKDIQDENVAMIAEKPLLLKPEFRVLQIDVVDA